MRTFLTVVVALALVVEITAHLSLLVGIARREPHRRWRALVATLVPPLAPYWGWELGMTRRTYAWLGAVAVYAIALLFI
ncbi:MAG: hypothetical protein ABIP39_14610 [Polyangiaceae bacterium]